MVENKTPTKGAVFPTRLYLRCGLLVLCYLPCLLGAGVEERLHSQTGNGQHQQMVSWTHCNTEVQPTRLGLMGHEHWEPGSLSGWHRQLYNCCPAQLKHCSRDSSHTQIPCSSLSPRKKYLNNSPTLKYTFQLLRRLFHRKEKCTCLLSWHSPVAQNWAGNGNERQCNKYKNRIGLLELFYIK